MDTPPSNKMDPCDILNLFLETEVDYHTYNSGQNLLININIGTKGTLDQEINKEWLQTITPVFLDPDYCKVFYYFDSEYRHLSFKNDHLKNLLDKMKDYVKLSNKCNLNFEFTRPFNNIETCINRKHNIFIHKVGYNLVSSYEAHTLHTNIIKNKLTYDVCYSSIPKHTFWNRFKLLLTVFNSNFIGTTVFINNYACTNSRFFIDREGMTPLYVNAYVGNYFEYVSELMYILKGIYNDYKNPNVNFLIRTKDYDKDKNYLVNLDTILH